MKTSFAMDIATNLRQQLVTMFREIGNEKKAAENLADCCLGLNNDYYMDADVCDIRQFLLPIWLDEVADVPIDDDVPETEWERDITVQGDLDQEILNAHEKSAPGEIIRGKRKREAMDDDALSDLLEDVGDVVCENPATPRDAIGRDLLDLEPGELDDLIRDCREHGGPSQPKRARVRADGFDDPGDPDYYPIFWNHRRSYQEKPTTLDICRSNSPLCQQATHRGFGSPTFQALVPTAIERIGRVFSF
mmetsp:Transcript_11329/g.24404  ORF Transcript_11329/g.24404 Transcript_11329/m.24404 type:complete len:248 (-) Transcript_11329:18-761(-)